MQVPMLLPGLRAIADQYDGYVLDLWGVIHDGHSAFPHSAETLRRLKEHGRKTILLSNAPRRAHALIAQMEAFGIPRDLYGDVMSSGEAVREAMIARTDPFFAALGEACFHIGPERDLSIFEDVPVRRVPLDEAEFIVNTGPSGLGETADDYVDLLRTARERDLPMVCANPDKLVIRQGNPVTCAGALAAKYEELGGRVAYRGKPDPAIYRLCAEKVGLSPQRLAVVGDSLETDVQGATAAGMTSIWVTGGIHARELDAGYGKPAAPLAIAALAEARGLAPTACVPGFIW